MAEIRRRSTFQRRLVLEAVEDLDHPSAEQVFLQVRSRYPDIGKATVYRNLTLLTQQGRLRRLECGDGADRFDDGMTPHYHVQCRVCGRFSDVFVPYNGSLDALAAHRTGFTELEHDLIFKGVCPECREEQHGSNGDV